MTTLISQRHNEHRLAGTLADLQVGEGVAKLRVYDDSGDPVRPLSINDAPTGVLAAEFALENPAGVVVANKLQIGLPLYAVLLPGGNGRLRWARFVARDGATSMDVDVGTIDGTVRPNAPIKFESVEGQLPGGLLRLLSAEIG